MKEPAPGRRGTTTGTTTGTATRQPQPRPVSASYLRNAAMHYLTTHSASVAMLRRTLERRAMRRLCVRVLEPPTLGLIETTIADLVALGLIDDARFADGRAGALARKGLGRRRIEQGLQAKGLDRETIARAIGEDFDELAQARRFVAQKRLGSHRRGGMTPATHRKDLAALARAGFAFAVARKALEPPEEP